MAHNTKTPQLLRPVFSLPVERFIPEHVYSYSEDTY